MAVEAAAEHGIHQASRVLGLNHSALKAAVQKRTDKVVGEAAAAGFVELAWPAAGGSGACMIEAEDGRGTTLRIYLKGEAAAAVTSLAQVLWGSRP